MGQSSTEDAFDEGSSTNSVKPDHNECLKILNLVLDEEAGPKEHEYFKKHVENCMPYYEIYNVDKAIKELIKQKCNDKKVPNDLVDQIKIKILQAKQQ